MPSATCQRASQHTKTLSSRENRHYLKRFREGGEDIESLADKSHANHSHPKWLTREDKEDQADRVRDILDTAGVEVAGIHRMANNG